MKADAKDADPEQAAVATRSPIDPRAVREALATQRPPGKVLQDYCPVSESLAWRLSRVFWESRGPEAFLGGDVPYVVTNDGRLASDAVALFTESLAAARERGDSEDPVYVLELGAGSGIFAKLFLDQLRAASHESGDDFYERTRYVMSDGSQSMLDATEESGVLSGHEGKAVRVRVRAPEILTDLRAAFDDDAPLGARFRLVIANYLLDSLPFTILSLRGDELWELRLRSGLEDAEDVERYSELTEASVLDILDSDAPEEREALIGVHRALVMDGRYAPVKRDELPWPGAIPDGQPPADGPTPLLHCYGALECADQACSLLIPGGLLLFSDYGFTHAAPPTDIFEFQHFGPSAAVGLNFPQIEKAFAARDGVRVVAPEHDPENLPTRMIGRDVDERVLRLFRERYSKAAWERLSQPISDAHELIENRQLEAARWKYEEALRLQPFNWSLMEEAAGFLAYQLADYSGGLTLAKECLKLNHLSPTLWNVIGDCFYYMDEFDEAESAYRHAMELSPSDVRSRLNLAYVAIHHRDLRAALVLLAEGLALDEDGQFRDALLAKQEEVLRLQSSVRGSELLRAANRFRNHRDLPGRGAS